MPEKFAAGKILEYGWLSLLAMGGYIFKKLSGQVEANSQALQSHIREDVALHDDFVKKDDWHEFKESIYTRFDKIDAKEDKILDKVINGVDRNEFKSELQAVYGKIDSLEQRKADK